jgi:hypothetical protein
MKKTRLALRRETIKTLDLKSNVRTGMVKPPPVGPSGTNGPLTLRPPCESAPWPSMDCTLALCGTRAPRCVITA